MRAVAANLRLELVLARDQLAGAADAHSVQQRRRAAAYQTVLCAQPAGAPLRLAHQIGLLLALADGKLGSNNNNPHRLTLTTPTVSLTLSPTPTLTLTRQARRAR